MRLTFLPFIETGKQAYHFTFYNDAECCNLQLSAVIASEQIAKPDTSITHELYIGLLLSMKLY